MTAVALDSREFTASLDQLDRPSILAVAAHLARERATPADDVAWWEDTLAIQGLLRSHRASRRAARSAHEACAAVQRSARRSGMSLPDVAVTLVARAAGEAARALVAEAVAGDGAVGAVDRLMQPFGSISQCSPVGGPSI